MNTAATGRYAGAGRVTVSVNRDRNGVDASTPWDQLVRDHAVDVYRFAYGLTRNPYDAEDLTQDVFVRVFRYLASYTPENFDGWLYRITVNLFRDQVRRRRQLLLEPLRSDAVDRYAAGHAFPEPLRAVPVFEDDVRAALAAMPPVYRVAVLLCDVDELTYDEIAAVLGVKVGTVGSRIHRGRAQLRAALAHRTPHQNRKGMSTRGAT